ncbi:MAG: ribokinase [Chloroflexi bacterium]|nr:ribokinase [Chloroflexota bacterium]MCL5274220.1 ribokinase [Chloroflexota bacterium]
MSSRSTRPLICVVGSVNMDLITRVSCLPRIGETLHGRSFHLVYGGKGANQAVMAAKMGGAVSMVARVGKDVFGEGMLRNFTEYGIDTTHVLVDDSRSSGVAPIFVDDQARNVIVIVAGANGALSPADVRAARGAILASSAVVCQLEVPIEATLEAFRIGKAGGVRTILNPAPAQTLPEELLALSDICAPNETETEQLTGMAVNTLEEAEAAGRALLERGLHTVVITLGERGALAMDSGSVLHVPALKVNAVDPTGAGDAFIGALAVCLGEGMALVDAIKRANTAAALSVTRIGAQISFPTRAEVDAYA